MNDQIAKARDILKAIIADYSDTGYNRRDILKTGYAMREAGHHAAAEYLVNFAHGLTGPEAAAEHLAGLPQVAVLELARLSYGSTGYDVSANDTLPLPATFDFDNPVECARTVLAIMSNAAGGHPLKGCKLAIHAARKTANITAGGAHVFYAPPKDERPKLTAEEVVEMVADRVVTMLGDVTTDQYGDGWKRARWTAPKAEAVAA